MDTTNFGKQVGNSEDDYTTIFERRFREPCGCESIEWTIITGFGGKTVVRKRVGVSSECRLGHYALRAKLMTDRSIE